MAKSVEEMLTEMNDTWEKGKDGPVVPPDGEYMMQLVNAEIGPNKAGDKLRCVRTHTIIEGEYANTTVRDFISLNEGQIFRLKQWIEQMGYEAPDNLSDVPAVLEAIIAENPTYTANLKSSGDFLNVTDFEVIGTESEDGDGSEEMEEAEAGGEEEETVEEETTESEESEGDYEDQEHMDLVTTAAACGVEIADGLSKEEVIAEMKGYDWDYNDFAENPEGLALIEKYGMDVVNKPAPTKKALPLTKKPAPAAVEAKKVGAPVKKPVGVSSVAKKTPAPAFKVALAGKKPAGIIRRK